MKCRLKREAPCKTSLHSLHSFRQAHSDVKEFQPEKTSHRAFSWPVSKVSPSIPALKHVSPIGFQKKSIYSDDKEHSSHEKSEEEASSFELPSFNLSNLTDLEDITPSMSEVSLIIALLQKPRLQRIVRRTDRRPCMLARLQVGDQTLSSFKVEVWGTGHAWMEDIRVHDILLLERLSVKSYDGKVYARVRNRKSSCRILYRTDRFDRADDCLRPSLYGMDEQTRKVRDLRDWITRVYGAFSSPDSDTHLPQDTPL